MVVGTVLIVFYWIDTATDQSSLFPDHHAGASSGHIQGGIGALLLGLRCLVFAWLRPAPRADSAR